MKFLISTDPANLAAALAGLNSATVEAEYGDTCVEGSMFTMAHHGSRSANPAPCSYPNGCVDAGKIDVVGLSHLDHDALGGIMAVLNRKPEVPGFWELSAFVDLNGPHKLSESGASAENIRRLHAYFAWSQDHRCLAPRDGSVENVSDQVWEAITTMHMILADNEELLAKGDAFKAGQDALNNESFVDCSGDTILRVSSKFVNHLYVTPSGYVALAVVGFNTITGAITVSFADAPQGKSARDIVQTLFGAEAGGHAGIAGSPRGKRMSFRDLGNAFAETIKVVCGDEVT